MQVEIINQEFLPSEKEIEKALKIVEIFKDAEKKGIGAISFENSMVDRPVYLRSLGLLKRAGISR